MDQKERSAGADLDRVAAASLKELGDIRIDDVLAFIDRGIEQMPSYMDLYRRWEAQQWSVGEIDFTLDREDWLKASDLDRKATLWSHRLFFNGEERVTATLAPFVWAAPTPEIEIFLSTQMVDEARHTVFFDRWWREVVGTETKNLTDLLAEIRPDTNEGYNTLFYDRLPSTAQRMASNPKDFAALVEGVTIYHIIVEATIALTGQRFELAATRELGTIDRGLHRGFNARARAESRAARVGTQAPPRPTRDAPRAVSSRRPYGCRSQACVPRGSPGCSTAHRRAPAPAARRASARAAPPPANQCPRYRPRSHPESAGCESSRRSTDRSRTATATHRATSHHRTESSLRKAAPPARSQGSSHR
mgnify:CR=1 FL=1